MQIPIQLSLVLLNNGNSINEWRNRTSLLENMTNVNLYMPQYLFNILTYCGDTEL